MFYFLVAVDDLVSYLNAAVMTVEKWESLAKHLFWSLMLVVPVPFVFVSC